ncbi:hypothetical protein PP178_04260 [Zeaxanthinibacter sp. PT1]|uniref:hypothetical protein n=1 Tax=Zeaxanthinibacter TaxID=561554 RepID=UPI002349E834|nr:hypothetical protein [Zeaxanthinibacter sp. PT1]MDC6350753.1 hypothetical protein [Zeaxanthinibacter sp. PT1]
MQRADIIDQLEEARLLHAQGKGSLRSISREIVKKYGLDTTPENFRKAHLTKYIAKHAAAPTDDHEALRRYCEEIGIPFESVGNYWHKGQYFSVHAKTAPVDYLKLRDELIEEMKQYSPQYPEIVRPERGDVGHLLVMDPADIHIGKLSMYLAKGSEYNNKIAVDRVHEGVNGLLFKAATSIHIDQILFIAGNDILHVDNATRTTKAGTPQDTDGMWYDNYQIAKKLYVELIELLLTVAPVHVHFNPSNHDFTNGYFLCDAVATWFDKHPEVSFDGDMRHRKYYQYHNNLIGTTHGDGAKTADLPLLMADEVPELWGATSKRYIYTHHVHHKVAKDMQKVAIESLRSPSGTDMWHHINGYNSIKAVEAFIHHPEHGQTDRLTYNF